MDFVEQIHRQTSDLNLNEFPLGLVIPENESVEKAIAEYQQKKNKLLEECRMDGDELYRKVDNELMNRSLPDIVGVRRRCNIV